MLVFATVLLGAAIRMSGQPVIGSVFSLLGLVAAGLVVADAVRRGRRRRAMAREKVGRLLTPGHELVGAVGGNSNPDLNG